MQCFLRSNQAFSPTEPIKPGDVLSRQNIPLNISETRISLPATYQDLIQRYQVECAMILGPILLSCSFHWPDQFSLTGFLTAQEFKNALKEDAIDYSIYTANIKRKRPTPRKGRKSVYGGGDEDDIDDEEWTGGVRRLSNSGRRGNSNRGSRQR